MSVQNPGGFNLFEAADYRLRFELFNAAFVSGDNELVIDAFDETGKHLRSSNQPPLSFEILYQVNTFNAPPILYIQPESRTLAEFFVHSFLPIFEPTTTRIQLRPILKVDVLDCNQHVSMRTWLRYPIPLVAADEPLGLVIPSVFLCP